MFGIVTKSSSNYFILFNGIESFYIPNENNDINIFSIIKIDGSKPYPIDFYVKYENAFDFKNYLKNSGIERKIYLNSYTQITNSYINCSTYSNNIISLFSNEKSKVLLNMILLDNFDYNDIIYLSLKLNGMLYIFSSSGLLLSFLKSKIVGLLKDRVGYFKSLIISFIILFPILIIKADNFISLRIFVNYIVNFIFYKKMNSMERNCLTYSILLLNRNAINKEAFYIPLIIFLFLNFSHGCIQSFPKFIRKIITSSIVTLAMFPFIVKFNNSINLFNLFLNIAFLWLFKYQYLLIYPSLFYLKFPFIENILSLEYDFFTLDFIKYLNINLPPFNEHLIVFYFLFLLIFLAFKEINFKKIYSIGIVGIFSIITIQILPIENTFYNEVSFINVGQGDATYIRNNGKNYLIDTGGNIKDDLASNCLIPFLRKKKVYNLDAVFITHYDVDHYYALDSLKKHFLVNNVYDYNNISEYKNNNFIVYNINTNFNKNVEENSRSLVLNFFISNVGFLVMGDAPIEVEKEIIKNYVNIDASILKVGHHGSDTSSSYEFLKYINPSEAVISCGINNIYHHPNDRVIKDLDRLSIKIRRTDQEGTISYKFLR